MFNHAIIHPQINMAEKSIVLAKKASNISKEITFLGVTQICEKPIKKTTSLRKWNTFKSVLSKNNRSNVNQNCI